MRFKLLVLAAFASLLVTVPAMAADQATELNFTDTDAVAVLLAMDQPTVRQNAVVRFWKPVRVAGKLLMGKYIIEHDNDRMAEGKPCTHIYDFYSRKLVASFHCEHLSRPVTGDMAQVSIRQRADGTGVLTEFQYANDAAAHGVPSVR
jgi:hypothetical protein